MTPRRPTPSRNGLSRPLLVIGTGTGVGKTVLTALLTRRLRERGRKVAALKPLCSGGRTDARLLRVAAGNVLTLDVVNPWHFREALAPLVAARRARRRVSLLELQKAIGRVRRGPFETVVIEGAGGLLSPLAEECDARTLMEALEAIPLVVAANRLGVLNEILLTVEALPLRSQNTALVVVMAPRRSSLAARTNLPLIRERLGTQRVHAFPWVEGWQPWLREGIPARLHRALDQLVEALSLP